MAKCGRKRLKNPTTRTISFCCTETQKKAIEKLVKNSGLNQSKFILRCIGVLEA